MKCNKNFLGVTKEGKFVHRYDIENKRGTVLSFIDFGAYIVGINTKDKLGKLENIVLAYDDFKSYEEDINYLGCIVGRVAGRISKGKANIAGTDHSFAQNNGQNHLHGGVEGFNKKLWKVNIKELEDSIEAELKYFSKDGEEGYPGNLEVTVKYTLNDKDELIIDYQATTDKTTIVNMTNHSNFNLSGDLKENILKHQLYVSADLYAEIDEESIPREELKEVKGTAFDFGTPKGISKAVASKEEQVILANKGIDHAFFLKQDSKPQVILKDLESGRVLEMETTNNAVVIYTSNFIDESLTLKGGRKGEKYLGICLEAQGLPDAINKKSFPSIILKPGEKYSQRTIYRFKVFL